MGFGRLQSQNDWHRWQCICSADSQLRLRVLCTASDKRSLCKQQGLVGKAGMCSGSCHLGIVVLRGGRSRQAPLSLRTLSLGPYMAEASLINNSEPVPSAFRRHQCPIDYQVMS